MSADERRPFAAVMEQADVDFAGGKVPCAIGDCAIVEPMVPKLVTIMALKDAWRDGFDTGVLSDCREGRNPYHVRGGTTQDFQLERAWNQGYMAGYRFPPWPSWDTADDMEDIDVSIALNIMASVAWRQAVI